MRRFYRHLPPRARFFVSSRICSAAPGVFGVKTNQFGFNFTGTPNLPIFVQAADNLANPVWTSLRRLTLTNGSYHFSEPFQPANPARFYRITSQ